MKKGAEAAGGVLVALELTELDAVEDVVEALEDGLALDAEVALPVKELDMAFVLTEVFCASFG